MKKPIEKWLDKDIENTKEQFMIRVAHEAAANYLFNNSGLLSAIEGELEHYEVLNSDLDSIIDNLNHVPDREALFEDLANQVYETLMNESEYRFT